MERLTGIHSVREALRAGRRQLVRLAVDDRSREKAPHREVVALAEGRGLPIESLQEAGGREVHQGLWLEAGALPEPGLEELMEALPPTPWLVALDGVEDPQNLGAIARVADGAGCAGLLLTRRHAPPLSPAVSRASAGAIEHLPVGRVPNLSRALAQLREHGLWSVGAVLEEGLPIYEVPAKVWEGPLVFVLGAEGKGLRPGVQGELDHRVEIPMYGRIDSLNVSAASAVLLYEAARHRGAPAAGRTRGKSRKSPEPGGLAVAPPESGVYHPARSAPGWRSSTGRAADL